MRTPETRREPGPRTAGDLTLPELREIAAGIGGSAMPVATDEMTGYILSQPQIQVDIFFKRAPNKLAQTLVKIGEMKSINLGNPRVNIAPRSITFVNEGEEFRDIFVVTPDLYGHSRIVKRKKGR